MPDTEIVTDFQNIDASPFNGHMIAHLATAITTIPEGTSHVAQEFEFQVVDGIAYNDVDAAELATLPVTASGSCNPGNTPISIFLKDSNGRRTYYKSVIPQNVASNVLADLVDVEPDAAVVAGAITGITYADEWDSATAYSVNECAFYRGHLWIATTAGTNQEPTEGSAYWGILVSGIYNAGAWLVGTTYEFNHIVTNAGSGWIAKRQNVGVTPVEGDDWGKLADKGDTGLTGDTGTQGATGPRGLPGIGSVAMPGEITFTRDADGKLTAIKADNLTYPITRTGGRITRIGGLSSSPALTRATAANNPETGAAVTSGNPRFVKGRNLITAAQSNVASGWDTTDNGGNIVWAHSGNSLVGTVGTELTGDAYADIQLNGVLLPASNHTFSANIEITGHTTGIAGLIIYDFVGGTPAYTDALISAGNVNAVYGVTRLLNANIDNSGSSVILRVYLPAGTNAGTVITITNAQFEEAAAATDWTEGGDQAILIEKAATNIFLANTENFQSNWVDYAGCVSTVTPGQADPFGGTNAYLIETAGGGSNIKKYGTPGGVMTLGTPYATSVLIKVDSAVPLTVTSNGQGQSQSVTQAEGWVKVEITGNGNGGSTQLHFVAPTAGDDLRFYAMWPQIEASADCTSYIAPGTTRNPESLTIPTANAVNPAEGAFIATTYIGGDLLGVSSDTPYIFHPGSGGADNIFLAKSLATLVANFGALGSTVTATWITDWAEGWHTLGIRWNSETISIWVDGVEKSSEAIISTPSALQTNTYIGGALGGVTGQWGSPIANAWLYKSAPTDAEMAANTVNGAANSSADFHMDFAGDLTYAARVNTLVWASDRLSSVTSEIEEGIT